MTAGRLQGTRPRQRGSVLSARRQRFRPCLEVLEDRCVPTGFGTGLTGTYYETTTLEAMVTQRVDATINFDWVATAPPAGLGPYNFSVRWIGQVEAEYTEFYTFYTRSDDGVRLYVGPETGPTNFQIDQFDVHLATEHSFSKFLVAGQKYNIVLEYFSGPTDAAVIDLSWSSASQTKQIIPQTQLYEYFSYGDNDPPQITALTQEQVVGAGQQATINGTFIDNDSYSWTVSIDWGDGSPIEVSRIFRPEVSEYVPEFSLQHIYAGEATYQPRIWVTDGWSNDTSSVSVFVLPAAPLRTDTAVSTNGETITAAIPEAISATLEVNGPQRGDTTLLVAELPNSTVAGTISVSAPSATGVQFLRTYDVRIINGTALDRLTVTFQVESAGTMPPLLEFQDPVTGVRMPVRSSRPIAISYVFNQATGKRIWLYTVVLDATSFPTLAQLYATVFTFSTPQQQLNTLPNLTALFQQAASTSYAGAGGVSALGSSLATPGFASGLQVQRAVGSSQVLSLDPNRTAGGEGDDEWRSAFSVAMALELINGVHQATWSSAAEQPPQQDAPEQQQQQAEPNPMEQMQEQASAAEAQLRQAAQQLLAGASQGDPAAPDTLLLAEQPLAMLLQAVQIAAAQRPTAAADATATPLYTLLLFYLLLLSPEGLAAAADHFGLTKQARRQRGQARRRSPRARALLSNP